VLLPAVAITTDSYAPGAVLAPCDPVRLIWTLPDDLIWFGDWPRSTTWIGTAMIVATGRYLRHREHARSRKASEQRL
jgi:hypothetical protein